MLDDDEPTTFEMNPLGNRQRLKPRESFLARVAALPKPEPAEQLPEMAVRVSMIVAEDEELLASGEHTISDVALPDVASAYVLPAYSYSAPLPSLAALPPAAAPVMLLPREIHYPAVATPYYPPTESQHALPIASRRVRYLAVPALAALALVVLGGAAIPPPPIEAAAPATHVGAAQEATSAPRVQESAHEPAPPPEVEEVNPAPRMVFAPRKISRPAIVARPLAHRIGNRPVTVNASSALGNLRPRRAW